MLDQIQKNDNNKIHFSQQLESVDLANKTMTFTGADNKMISKKYDILIGTDGSASAVRQSFLQAKSLIEFTSNASELSHGYKEFVMSSKKDNQFLMEKNALHIWPRGQHMMIALPNSDGTYTCTLFLSNSKKSGVVSFEDLTKKGEVNNFFKQEFPDFCRFVPDYLEQYFAHPAGKMVTQKCYPWNYKGEVLLVGDAAHAIVPFFGQGMNCGFEDVMVFETLLTKFTRDGVCDFQKMFTQFSELRKTNSDAIADMAIENFSEMSEKVADEKFIHLKKIEKQIQLKFPNDYRSRYSLVSFSLVPYRLAFDAGLLQSEILQELYQDSLPDKELDFDRVKQLIETKLSAINQKIKSAEKDNKKWI